jgi:hypothetical protein
MTQFSLQLCIEIYITNECNLTCSKCNRYNNYDFQGHYSWKDSQEAINAWAKRITAPMITIIGGEPSLHPELQQWTEGVAAAWPDRNVMIQTNGLKPLVDLPWWNQATSQYTNIGTGIAVHSQKMQNKLQMSIEKSNPHFEAWMFDECAIIEQGNSFRTHNSDPEDAFSYCGMKHSHTILHGKLHKCPMVAVLPEFRKQYQVDLLDGQEQLLNEYQPLDYNCSNEELEQFVTSANDSIPQCRLCPGPTERTLVNFDPTRKKYPKKI